MKWLVLFVAFVAFILMAGCEDRYRYICQNPDHFMDTECQKPRCQFTQTCPEYLVAPILERKLEAPIATPDR